MKTVWGVVQIYTLINKILNKNCLEILCDMDKQFKIVNEIECNQVPWIWQWIYITTPYNECNTVQYDGKNITWCIIHNDAIYYSSTLQLR